MRFEGQKFQGSKYFLSSGSGAFDFDPLGLTFGQDRTGRGLRFRVEGVGVRVQGLGVMVYGVGFGA